MMMGTKKSNLSAKVLLVLLRRLERRRVEAAAAWEGLRGRLCDEGAMRGYVCRLRQCERLHAILADSPALRVASLN